MVTALRQVILDPSRTNAIAVPSNNKAFVTDYITRLNMVREKNQIVLFGLDSWTDFDNLDLDYLNNMHFHYPSPTFVDYENEQVRKFIQAYYSRFRSDPGFFVFQGFDVACYYLNMLYTNGDNFQDKLSVTKKKGLQTDFDFYQVSPESGFENKAVKILMYKDYKLVKAD